jgi:hypothetical protein
VAASLKPAKGILDNANAAQRDYWQQFSGGQPGKTTFLGPDGKYYGRLCDDVLADLQAGRMTPADLPVEYIVRDGNTLMLNTRSAKVIEQAGIPRGQWYARNVTGIARR